LIDSVVTPTTLVLYERGRHKLFMNRFAS
jgi:hypothetical protein